MEERMPMNANELKQALASLGISLRPSEYAVFSAQLAKDYRDGKVHSSVVIDYPTFVNGIRSLWKSNKQLEFDDSFRYLVNELDLLNGEKIQAEYIQHLLLETITGEQLSKTEYAEFCKCFNMTYTSALESIANMKSITPNKTTSFPVPSLLKKLSAL